MPSSLLSSQCQLSRQPEASSGAKFWSAVAVAGLPQAGSHSLDLSTIGRPERQLQQPWGHSIDPLLIALAPHCWVDLEREVAQRHPGSVPDQPEDSCIVEGQPWPIR